LSDSRFLIKFANMINILAKVHDKFSIEMKVGFYVRRKLKNNDFTVNTWIFIPNNLDINQQTYSKNQFYRDVKSNIRLITPVFLLREITDAIIDKQLKEAFSILASDPTKTNTREYEHQVKMFGSIFKSALRDECRHILEKGVRNDDDVEYLVSSTIKDIKSITSAYRALRKIINVPTISEEVLNYFSFCDEFIAGTIEHYLYSLIKDIPDQEKFNSIREEIIHCVKEEEKYKKEKGYIVIKPDDPANNRELVFRYGILKKFVESDLFLKIFRKRDGVIIEQIYFSLAAGLSMVFATSVAFYTQLKYGNFTMPLFVALVVSYMLKDRIKELMRFYFVRANKEKYFDNKTTISLKDNPIGFSKEGMDFITEEMVPQEIMKIRARSPLIEAENRISDEKIILYRKIVKIDREKMIAHSQYVFPGINDIMRLYITRFTQKMDNPETPLFFADEKGKMSTIIAEKTYYLNIIMELQFDEQTDYKRYRIVFSRNGIINLEELV